MGRVEPPPNQSSDPPPQGYQPPPPHGDDHTPPPPPPPPAEYVNETRSYVPPEELPPPAPYPPPHSYPPPQRPAPYPPQQQQQQQPVQFPPTPPQQQQQPVQFPPQTYNYAQQQQQPPQGYVAGYQTPVKTEGIAIGSQYLAPTQGWSSELFDCANDPENAIITACFPCITFGQIAEIVDNGQTSCGTTGLIYGVIAAFTAIPCIMSCSYRTKIRSRYGLIEAPAPDWVTHCFCEWCALCQEYRELKARGFDPAIGWQGNLMRNQQQMQQYPTMTPPMNQAMM